MDSKERNFLLVGALLAGGAAGLAYLYNKTKDEQMAKFRPRTVSRKLIVRILKEVQREMFGVLTSVAMITTQIKEQYKGRITPDEIKNFLLEHSKSCCYDFSYDYRFSNKRTNEENFRYDLQQIWSL